MDDLTEQLRKVARELGLEFKKLLPPPQDDLRWPFSQVTYFGKCPNGHSVMLDTGYNVCAPDWWEQWGWCSECGRFYRRQVELIYTPTKDGGLIKGFRYSGLE